MAYGRYRRRPRKTYKRKGSFRRVYRRKRKAKGTAKVAYKLAKRALRENKSYFERRWIRPIATIVAPQDGGTVSPASGDIFCYMLPIPLQTPSLGDVSEWRDNGGESNTTTMGKGVVFNMAPSDSEVAKVRHLGSTLSWQLSTTDPVQRTYFIAIVRPKFKTADALMMERGMLTEDYEGFYGPKCNMRYQYDFEAAYDSTSVPRDDISHVKINPKLWTVLGHRQVVMGYKSGEAGASVTQPSTTESDHPIVSLSGILNATTAAGTRNTALTAAGTFKLKGVGYEQGSKVEALHVTSANQQSHIKSETNEKRTWLIIIGRAPAIYGESGNMGPVLSTHCLDRYCAVT